MRVYLNGQVMDEADAVISVTDHSFLYGDGCFDAIGVWGGRLINLDEHLRRFRRSAQMMRLEVPISEAALRSQTLEIAAANGLDGARHGSVRVVLSRGGGAMGIMATQDAGPPTLVIMATPGSSPDPLGGEVPTVRAIVSRFHRADPAAQDPRVKCTSYATSVLAFLEARDAQADVAILRDSRGYVAEAHAANVFCIRGDAVLTPPESRGLAGITRRHVISVAKDLGYRCDEVDLTTYDLHTADELFLTASNSGITAVTMLDGRPVSDGPGEITGLLAHEYAFRAHASGAPIQEEANQSSP